MVNYILNGNVPLTTSKEVYDLYAKESKGRASILTLYQLINSTNTVYDLLSKKIVLGAHVKDINESLRILHDIAGRVKYSDKVINEIRDIIELQNKKFMTIEAQYNMLSDIHVENNLPKGYDEFISVFKSSYNLNSTIKEFENRGYTKEEIIDLLLNTSSNCENMDLSRIIYYRTYDYLVNKGIDEKTASKMIYDKASEILDIRGTRVVAYTKSGKEIRMVNNYRSDNPSVVIKDIIHMINEAEKLYPNSNLKTITIYDTFSPKNIYSEKVQYENYVDKNNGKRFISSASATQRNIDIWNDFNDLYTIIHEYAHTIDWAIAKKEGLNTKFSESEEWINAIKQDEFVTKNRASKYASANNAEDFAEFIKEFYKKPLEVAIKYPNRYKVAAKYLNMKISKSDILNYAENTILYNALENMKAIMTEEGTALELVKQYLLEDVGENSITNILFDVLDGEYEYREEILLDWYANDLLPDIIDSENISVNSFLEILKDYIDGKDVSIKFTDSRNLEILKLLPIEEIQEWYNKIYTISNEHIDVINKALESKDITGLTDEQLLVLVDNIKQDKIDLQNYDLNDSSIRLLGKSKSISDKVISIKSTTSDNTLDDIIDVSESMESIGFRIPTSSDLNNNSSIKTNEKLDDIIDVSESIKNIGFRIPTSSDLNNNSSIKTNEELGEIIDASEKKTSAGFKFPKLFNNSSNPFISKFDSVLQTGDITTLSDNDLKKLIQSIKNRKINVKDYPLNTESLEILLKHLPVSKVFPLSVNKAVNSFIQYFGIETIIEFDKLNNGFLFSDGADRLYALYELLNRYMPKNIGEDKLQALEDLITNIIVNHKEPRKEKDKPYQFSYRRLEGTEYAKKHSELFLDENAPPKLKNKYYSGRINSGNGHRKEWSKFLEGKIVDGKIHEPTISYDECHIMENIDRVREINRNKFEKELTDLANRVGLSVDEVQRILDRKLQILVNESLFGIRRTSNSLLKILDDGKFKNQLEVDRTTAGIYSPELRVDVENEMFDIPRNLRYEDRPIYGMLLPQDLSSYYVKKGPGSFYSGSSGVIWIFDKSKIFDDCTLVLGDSICDKTVCTATSVRNPKFGGISSKILSTIKTREDLEKFNFSDIYTRKLGEDHHGYYEFQLHKEESHLLNVVKEILFLKQPNDEIIQRLKERNIPWRVI